MFHFIAYFIVAVIDVVIIFEGWLISGLTSVCHNFLPEEELAAFRIIPTHLQIQAPRHPKHNPQAYVTFLILSNV